jgi:hypothetical protein
MASMHCLLASKTRSKRSLMVRRSILARLEDQELEGLDGQEISTVYDHVHAKEHPTSSASLSQIMLNHVAVYFEY